MSSTTQNKNASDKKIQKVRKVKKEEATETPTQEAAPAEKPKATKAEKSEKPEKTEEKAAKRGGKAKAQKEEVAATTEAATTDAAPQTPATPAVTASILDERFERLLRVLDEERQRIKECINDVRDMRKQVKKQLRDNKKKRRDHKGGNANKAPSGFAQPCRISDDLCAFLGRENGELVPRTTVTKEIIKYIKDNDLQNANNRKKIEPDEKLRKLVGNAEDLTFFNLQVHLNPHFPRKAKKEDTATPASAAA